MNVDYGRSAIKVSEIKQQSIRDLEMCLESMPGEKILVLDEQIIGPLNLIASPALLSVMNVKSHVEIPSIENLQVGSTEL